MDAAVAALLGALIGVAGSVAGVWLQQRHETKRIRMRIATELALADWKVRLEAAGLSYPIALNVLYQSRALEAVAAGQFSADTIRHLDAEQEELIAAYDRVNEERREVLRNRKDERL